MFLHLKLQHGFSFVGLEHEAKCSYPRVGIIRLLPVSLGRKKNSRSGRVCCINVQRSKTKNERTQKNNDLRAVFRSFFVSAYVEGSQGLADTFLDEVVCDASRRVLVEDGVHQGDLGCAASRFGLGGTELADGNTSIISTSPPKKKNDVCDVGGERLPYLEAPEAAAAGEADVADVGGAGGGDHFINNQGSVWQVGPSGQLHLPKLLQSFHHIHCSTEEEEGG